MWWILLRKELLESFIFIGDDNGDEYGYGFDGVLLLLVVGVFIVF